MTLKKIFKKTLKYGIYSGIFFAFLIFLGAQFREAHLPNGTYLRYSPIWHGADTIWLYKKDRTPLITKFFDTICFNDRYVVAQIWGSEPDYLYDAVSDILYLETDPQYKEKLELSGLYRLKSKGDGSCTGYFEYNMGPALFMLNPAYMRRLPEGWQPNELYFERSK